MALQLTLPTLLGVIIGSVAFLFCLAAAIVVISLRIKHRKLLVQINAAGERRLSRYPGGHLSITDEDVARIPGTAAAMRKSLGQKYSRASAYTPMASRETIERQSGVRKSPLALIPRLEVSSKAIFSDGESPTIIPPPNPWPLPRRLIRANRPPVIELQPSALSLVAEATNGGDKPLTEPMCRTGHKLMPRQEYKENQSPRCTYDGQGLLGASRDLIAFPNPTLKPKPLFHEKPRSISHDMISNSSGHKKSAGVLHVFEPQQPLIRPCFPRSISLTNQEPGTVPSWATPPLPAEAVAIRQRRSMRASGSRQSAVASNSRQSLGGAVWRDTAIVGGSNSMTFHRSETNKNPITLIANSPVEASQKNNDPFKEDRPQLDDIISGPPVSPIATQKRMLNAPLDPHKSFRASIRNSIPRSNCSGLSESLLNHGWSRPASNAPMVRELCDAPARSKTPLGCSLGSHTSMFDFGLPTDLDRGDATSTQPDLNDIRDKRRSMSILQTISGNKQSPNPDSYNERPSSIAIENPLRWNKDVSAKEAAAKGEGANAKADDRQTCFIMPNEIHILSTQASLKPAITTEQEDVPVFGSPPQVQSLRRPRADPPTFRPPTRLTFDPQLTPTRYSKTTIANSANTSPYFKTLAKLTGYEDYDSSPSSILSTPTRKPSQKRGLSGTHPNRQRAIFDSPDNHAQWPLARQHQTLSLGLRSTSDSPKRASVFRLDAQLNTCTSTKDNDREEFHPSSLLYRFPSPPSPTSVPSWRQPPPKSKSQPTIQGPRPEPASSYRSPRRRPYPVESSTVAKNSNGSPGDELRQSVIALRRMNSEISDVDKAGREHKRYLSLGDRESAILEDGSRDDCRREEGKERRRSSGPKVMAAATATTTAAATTTSKAASARCELARCERGGVKLKVKGPRAMPGWINESVMLTSEKEVRITSGGGGGVLGTDGS